MKIQIDCYGFEAASEHFQRRKLEAFLVKNENAPAANSAPAHRAAFIFGIICGN